MLNPLLFIVIFLLKKHEFFLMNSIYKFYLFLKLVDQSVLIMLYSPFIHVIFKHSLLALMINILYVVYQKSLLLALLWDVSKVWLCDVLRAVCFLSFFFCKCQCTNLGSVYVF